MGFHPEVKAHFYYRNLVTKHIPFFGFSLENPSKVLNLPCHGFFEI